MHLQLNAPKAPMLSKDFLKVFTFGLVLDAPRAPMLSTDFLKVFSLRIVLKDLPSGVLSLRTFLTYCH